jgi:hypothetical protein
LQAFLRAQLAEQKKFRRQPGIDEVIGHKA